MVSQRPWTPDHISECEYTVEIKQMEYLHKCAIPPTFCTLLNMFPETLSSLKLNLMRIRIVVQFIIKTRVGDYSKERMYVKRDFLI